MFLSSNLQYLRRRSGMSQEKLAQRMGVSRQTVSKWESGEACPEIGNLMELCGIFSCKLDPLLREDLSLRETSPVRILRVEQFRMARYIMISPQAEQDVRDYMDRWARECGLAQPGYIHWAFSYVSTEQRERFGLRGHAGACILPADFTPACGGPEILVQEAADYAVMTVRDGKPQSAYPAILEHLREHGIRKSAKSGYLPCFERTQEDGSTDVFVLCEGGEAEEALHLDEIYCKGE